MKKDNKQDNRQDSREDIPSINFLHKEKDIKEKARLNIFNIVLNRCIEKILYANKHTDKTFIIFEVPNILIGFPSYDRISCTVFLKNQLLKSDYKVEYIDPFYLYIDWGTNTKRKNGLDKIENYIKTENPQNLKNQTAKLLKKFPDTSKIIFEYK